MPETQRRQTKTTVRTSKGKEKLVRDNLSPSSGKTHNSASLSHEQIEMRKRMEHILEQAETLTVMEKETAYKQPLEPFKHSCLDRDSASNIDNTSSEDDEQIPSLISPIKPSTSNTQPLKTNPMFNPYNTLLNPPSYIPDPLTIPNTRSSPTSPSASHVPPLSTLPQVETQPIPANTAATPQLDPMMLLQTFIQSTSETNRTFMQNASETNRLLTETLAKQANNQVYAMTRQSVQEAKDSIKPFKDNANICQYIDHFEAVLTETTVPKCKWKSILVGKLSTKAEKHCKNLIDDRSASYADLRDHLINQMGPTIDELCNILHGSAFYEFKDKTESEKLQHATDIAERFLLGAKDVQDCTYRLAISLYKFHCNKRFTHSIKLTKHTSVHDLAAKVSSFDSQLAYDRTKTQRYSGKQQSMSITCNYCKKRGHIEADCYKKQNSQKEYNQRDYKQEKRTDSRQPQNYKSKHYQQDKRLHMSRDTPKDSGVKPRPVTVNWGKTNKVDSVVLGQVNQQDAEIIVDTGAQITVVPGRYVYTDNLTGDIVSILGVNGDPVPYEMAEVPITLHGKTVVEMVAVAPADQLNAKVLLSMPLDNRAANALIDNFLDTRDDTATNKAEPNNDTKSKPQHTSDVLALVARKQPERKANKILNYFLDTSNTETENSQHFDDDRASDSTYSSVTDTELSNSD